MKTIVVILLTLPEPSLVTVSCLIPVESVIATLPILKGERYEKTY